MQRLFNGSKALSLAAAVGAMSCVCGITGSASAKNIVIPRTAAFEADQEITVTSVDPHTKEPTFTSAFTTNEGRTAAAGNAANAGNVQTSPILELGFKGAPPGGGVSYGSATAFVSGTSTDGTVITPHRTANDQGGQSVVFYLKLPQLLPGRQVENAHFNVSLLHDNFAPSGFLISPRFSADLYGAGVVRNAAQRTPNPADPNSTFFYTGHNADTAAGADLGGAQVQLLQHNFFTLRDPTTDSNRDNVPDNNNQDFHFPDTGTVNFGGDPATGNGYKGRVFLDGSASPTLVNNINVNNGGTGTFTNTILKGSTRTAAGTGNVDPDGGGDAALSAYIKSIYANPNFINDGNSYVALRLNPDYKANESTPATLAQGLLQPAANGTTRFILPSNTTDFSSGVYAGANPGTLSLGVFLQADANGDDSVTVGDLGILATNFNQAVPGGTNPRSFGDFNNDGSVTVGDLGILATYFNQNVGNGPFLQALAQFPELQAAVPEPTALGLVGVGAFGLLARRRRMSM